MPIRAPVAVLALLVGVALGLALAPEPAAAQYPALCGPLEMDGRPRIGLVLAGGGVRGAAHAGVLKVLEELRVPVDCIAGTSMGSIVGGLYASGWSPQQLEELVAQEDWIQVFNDSPPRRRIPFRTKQDDRLSLLPVEVGLGKKTLKLPPGIVTGQNIDFMLRRLTLGTLGLRDFDRLPIPFRAVAADLDDGSAVVLASGSLAEALRASMAFPGVLSPYRLNGRLLVDGGIANNLPVNVVREMGADVILAINVGTPVTPMKDGDSLVAVLRQTLNLLTEQNVVEQKAGLRPEDLLLEPELGDIQPFSFDRMAEALKLGEAYARTRIDDLRRLSVSEAEFDAYLRRQRGEPDTGDGSSLEGLTIDEIWITGSERVSPKQIRGRIRSRPGDPVDLEVLREDLERIYQIGEFERVGFRLEEEEVEEGRRRLIVRADDKRWGPNYLRAGMRFQTNLSGDSNFLALGQVRRTQLNPLGAEWKTTLTVGDISNLVSEFFQPLDYLGRFFVAPSLEVTRDEVFDGSGQLGLIEANLVLGGLEVGLLWKGFGELRFGLSRGQLDAKSSRRGSINPAVGGWRLRATLDQLDSLSFPAHGTFLEGEWFQSSDSLGADDEYELVDLRFAQAWTIPKLGRGRTSFLLRADYATSIRSQLPEYADFELGGFQNLSGLDDSALRGDSRALAALTLIHRRPGGLYLGASVEAGNAWATRDEVDLDDLLGSALVFLGRDTYLGPVYIGYGQSTAGDGSLYLFFGQPF